MSVNPEEIIAKIVDCIDRNNPAVLVMLDQVAIRIRAIEEIAPKVEEALKLIASHSDKERELRDWTRAIWEVTSTTLHAKVPSGHVPPGESTRWSYAVKAAAQELGLLPPDAEDEEYERDSHG